MDAVTLAPHVMNGPGKPLDGYPEYHREGIPLNVWLTGAPILWQQGIDGSGCVIGILDTGIDDSHPDLQKCPDGRPKILGRRDYVQDGAKPHQFNPHGTHVAGTAAANGRLKGVAPGAQIRDYRVLDLYGFGKYEHIAQAIRDAADDGCHIISMSLGGRKDYPPMQEAIRYAINKGALVIVAVGNDGPNQISYPAYYPEVVGVGAVYWDRYVKKIMRAFFSNTNKEVDVCTVGVDILSTLPGGLYGLMSGTSMATPAAAGFAALQHQKAVARLGYLPDEDTRWEMLKTSTVDVADIGIDAQTGAGLVTAFPCLPAISFVQVAVDSTRRIVNGKEDKMDVAPTIVGGRTMVPVRHTHEPLGDGVLWNPDDRSVTISRWVLPGMEMGQPYPSWEALK